MSARKPCLTCPWRVDQHADEIPNFRLDLAEKLDRTCGDGLDGGTIRPIFACHQSRAEQEVVCVGWLWRYGWDSIAIRLRLMNGIMSPDELEPDPAIVLHDSFGEVIAKLRDDCR
jgi:hypothetical protein